MCLDYCKWLRYILCGSDTIHINQKKQDVKIQAHYDGTSFHVTTSERGFCDCITDRYFTKHYTEVNFKVLKWTSSYPIKIQLNAKNRYNR